jgi:hypothetical protein
MVHYQRAHLGTKQMCLPKHKKQNKAEERNQREREREITSSNLRCDGWYNLTRVGVTSDVKRI